MNRKGLLALLCVASVAIAGCNHPSATGGDSSHPVSTVSLGPAAPAVNADIYTWGKYLAEQGKLHGSDVRMHPYIYVIPAGDSVAATARRQSEADSIAHSVGPILIPGGMLIVGGPDPKQTATFIDQLSKQLKVGVMKGIVVMVVGNPAQQAAIITSLTPSGATVRFVAM